MTPTTRSTGSKLLGTASARSISLGLTAIATVLVVRRLGPAQTGVYYVLINIAMTATTLGHLSVMHAYVFLWGRGDNRRSLGANAVRLGLASGSLAAIAALIIVHLLGPQRLPVGGRYDLLNIALLAVPASIVVIHVSALLALGSRIGRVNVATVGGALLPFAATLVLYATDRLTLTAGLLVWFGFSVLPAVGLVTAFPARRRDVSRGLALGTLKVGLQYHLAAVALFLLLRADVFILNAQVSDADVGLYSVAVAIAELTFLFTDSLAQVVLPSQVQHSLQKAGEYTAYIMRVSLVICVLIVLGLALGGRFVVPLIFGDAFRRSAGAILALGPGIVAFAMIRTLGGVLIRLDRPFLISGVTTAALVANVALNLILIPHFGIIGAGVASSLAYSGLAVFHTFWLLKATSLPGSVMVPRRSDLRRLVAAARRIIADTAARSGRGRDPSAGGHGR